MSVEDTLAERGARYGDFTDHAAVCQKIKLAMIAGAAKWACLPDTHKQALEVIADKIARILTGDPNYADNWHDIQGYAKLVEDRLPEGRVECLSVADNASVYKETRGRAIHTMSNPPGEDVYAEFAARIGTADPIQRAIEESLSRQAGETITLGEFCQECGYPTNDAGTHYATCSQLTAPEEYKAEAQVAFDEAAEISEALARQVSGGTAGHTIRPPKEVLAEVSEAWRRAVEPAAAMDDDSPRMQSIGQNGEMASEVYAAVDDPFAGAPEWAKYKAQDEDGEWWWFCAKPHMGSYTWLPEVGDYARGRSGGPNPNWRDTLITRT